MELVTTDVNHSIVALAVRHEYFLMRCICYNSFAVVSCKAILRLSSEISFQISDLPSPYHEAWKLIICGCLGSHINPVGFICQAGKSWDIHKVRTDKPCLLRKLFLFCFTYQLYFPSGIRVKDFPEITAVETEEIRPDFYPPACLAVCLPTLIFPELQIC